MSEPSKPFNILVIDDSISIVKSLEKMLEHHGHHVVTAYNAFDALRLVEHNNFDLAICDIEMPGMSGFEFIHKIKQRLDYAMDVVLMTGFLEQNYYVQAIRFGAADFICKPIECDELLATIERVRHKRDRVINQSLFFKNLHGFNMEFYIDPARFIKSSLDKAFSFFFEINLGFTRSIASELLICMEEMVFNAIIHGVLQLSAEERQLGNEQIRALALQKLSENPDVYRNRVLLSIEVDQDQKQIVISVEDEGKGFDFEGWLEHLENNQEVNLDSHGRGINMIKHFCDSLSFEKNGSKVSIVKELQ
ncbi:MAG: response regulator [Candidatus Cloacimonadaceae bacterium]|jgi:CheY-like chemotaxis protein